MKTPAQVTAAYDMIRSARDGVNAARERYGKPDWDTEVAVFEMARMLGAVMRGTDIPPSQLEAVVNLARRVYAGEANPAMPDLDEVLRVQCPEVSVAEDAADEEGGRPEGVTLQ